MINQTFPARCPAGSTSQPAGPSFFLRLRIALALLAVGIIAPGARAASDEQIQNAMNRAKDYLYSVQQPSGLWEYPGLPHQADGGLTAIATYALLAEGESSSSARLAKAIQYLTHLKSDNVYVLGVRAQIWSFLGENRQVQSLEEKDAAHLTSLIKPAGEARGLFQYPNMPPDTYDHSISQYGVLGLWALAQDNAEVGTATWDAMDQAWRRHQSQAGGWAYIMHAGGKEREGDDTVAMTCAGVATLFITHDYVHAAEERECNGNPRDANIEQGMKWITQNFDHMYTRDRNSRDYIARLYTLYGIERIGVAAGYKYFGNINWFESGSNYLVSHQNPDGSFGKPAQIWGMNVRNIPGTAFALLFLSNGNAPVVIDKLTYASIPPQKGAQPVPDYWNQRPRDMFNLSHWMSAQTESPLKWNIVTLATPVAELHEAPIVYLAGSLPLALSDGDIARLRQFVEEGGMLLANADCGSKSFTQSFTAACSKMFPNYEFRELPENHPIFTNQQYPTKKWPNKPRLLGLSNGVRELVILAPEQDPSRVWQVPYQGNVIPYAMGADILEYATERTGIRDKRNYIHFEVNPAIATTRTLQIARISYGGNWDPEPGAWRNMDAISHDLDKIDDQITTVELGHGQLDPGKFKLAALTGTAQVNFTAQQWDEIKNFVNRGGTLLIDAAGGSSAFADSMETGLSSAFGPAADSLKMTIPDDDPLHPPGLGDRQIYRAFARKLLGGTRSLRLRVTKINNRNAIIFSREDLTNGMVGEDVDGVIGYTPEVATRIVGMIVLSVTK